MEKLLNWINGVYCEPAAGKYLDNVYPGDGSVISKVANSNLEDLEDAILAGEKAFPNWKRKSLEERSAIMHKLADLIEENLEELAMMETKDTGKPITLSKTVDIPRAAANFRFFASAIISQKSETFVTDTRAINYTVRHPLGLVGCISPWNLPLYLFTWKIAPALAMGNCVIAKPSELTPTTAAFLGGLSKEAGMPDGVLNILQGEGASIGNALVSDRRIKAISFTGGTETGKKINLVASQQFKKVSLEMGGKNPVIVFDDCDFEDTVTNVVNSSFRNQGEICLCCPRILIQEGIYEEFKNALIEHTEKLKIGDPMDSTTEYGALISEGHKQKVLSFIGGAVKDGGNILYGGSSIDQEGYFVEPTIMEGLGPDCTINQQEVFGPVVTLIPFKDEEEAIQIANSTSYGLACSIWTRDVKRANRVGLAVKSGIIWVNCWMLRDLRTPFGGMKSSGMGREGGEYALNFFTELQNICIKQ